MTHKTLVWLRHDLRLHDNPAVLHGVANDPCAFVYIFDDITPNVRPLGGASKVWLHHALASLKADIEARGGTLILRRGAAQEVIEQLVRDEAITQVVWNRSYTAAEQIRDCAIKEHLKAHNIEVQSFNSHLLREPWELKTGQGTPYKVFTPFWRTHLAMPAVPYPQPAPKKLLGISGIASDSLDQLQLLPAHLNWSHGITAEWQISEQAALANFHEFLERGIAGYAQNRDRPDVHGTSKLSPYLAFGMISPRYIFHTCQNALQMGQTAASQIDMDRFLAEIGWREFSYHLLYYFPELATRNFQPKFDTYPWEHNPEALQRWQRGQTGFPIVDAGMRQLWQTGWMHNRVRMIVASFLVKDVFLDWRAGETWFWDTLVDADPASNTASWQWVAGCGADAAPYFRVFNPTSQGVKFDPKGDYIRKFVPELAHVLTDSIHAPHEAPPFILSQAGVTLGVTYPHPIVNHAKARVRALEIYSGL